MQLFWLGPVLFEVCGDAEFNYQIHTKLQNQDPIIKMYIMSDIRDQKYNTRDRKS